MLKQTLLIIAFCYFLEGCATTQSPVSVNHLEMKIARIEKKTDEQNQEISALRNEIEALSNQLASLKRQQTTPPPIKKSVSPPLAGVLN